MFESEEAPVLQSTLLSKAPSRNAKRVAFASLFLMLVTSVMYWENPFSLSHYLDAVPQKVFEGHEFWRPFTAMFVHADNLHFLGNAVSFTALSFLLYGYFGFWVFPCAVLALGTLANVLSLLTYPPEAHLLGMSGAIYVMAGFWLALYVFIDRRFSVVSRLIRALGFAFVIFIPSNVSLEVSYRTHAFGFGLGVSFGVIYFLFRKRELRSAERYEYT